MYLLLFVILTLYGLNLLINHAGANQNVYDILMQLTEFLSFSYMIMPTFLALLISHFSQGPVQEYIAFRYSSRIAWYHMNIVSLAVVTTGFTGAIFSIIVMQSLFILDFHNEWSLFAQGYYTQHTVFMSNISPITYIIMSALLLWLVLFLFGVLFYLIFLWTKKLMLAAMIIILLIVANSLMTLNKLETWTPYFFTDHLSIMQYVYKFETNQQILPIQMMSYWLVGLVIVYIIGRVTVGRVDLYWKKVD